MPFVGKTDSAPRCCLCSFVTDQLTAIVRVFFWAPCSAPWIHTSVPSPTAHHLDHGRSVASLEVGWYQPSNFVLQYWVAYSGSFDSFKSILELVCRYPKKKVICCFLKWDRIDSMGPAGKD